MSKSSKNQSGGFFLTGLLLVFIALKLANIGIVASWSWWWVFSPVWIPLLIAAVILLIAGLLSLRD